MEDPEAVERMLLLLDMCVCGGSYPKAALEQITVLLDKPCFPDKFLVQDMRSGFALTGWVRDSHLFRVSGLGKFVFVAG